MSTVAFKRRLTPEEYLVIEAAATFKSEFRDGEMYAMSGGNFEHTAITSNTQGQLYMRLRGGPRRQLNPDQRVHVPGTQLYVYPDVTVLCATPQFADAGRTTVINPTLIVEVLSPSTERYDRTEKFWNYQGLASFSDYLLVSQDAPVVEHFLRRTVDGQSSQWLYEAYKGLDAVVKLPALNIEIPLAEIYEKIDFPPAKPSSDDPTSPGPS